jgi:copper oxidase (laccase) domain-containing protein
MSEVVVRHPTLHIPRPENGMAIAHSGREFGNMDFRFGSPESVIVHRARLYGLLDLRVPQVAVMKPANDAETFVDLRARRAFAEDILTDGFITPERGVGLAMNLADCNAIALSDGQTLGMIHAGWRGAVQAFPNRVIGHMVKAYSFDPERAVAYFAPAIEKSSYVMPELHPAQHSEAWEPYIEAVPSDKGEQFHIDLPGFLSQMLMNEWGVSAERIIRTGIDVGADDSHFSYTRTKQDEQRSPNGRNGFVAVHNDITRSDG